MYGCIVVLLYALRTFGSTGNVSILCYSNGKLVPNKLVNITSGTVTCGINELLCIQHNMKQSHCPVPVAYDMLS